jgi:uncharacterized protein YdeI (YjbR/CyaY-like superfamily)
MAIGDLKIIDPKNTAGLRRWLNRNHGQRESVWVTIYKKHMGPNYLSYNDVVEEGLCFGWIDSRPRKLDEDRFLILFSPRRPKSVWSAINKKKIRQHIIDRRMTTFGLQKVQEAKKNGSWSALAKSDRLEIPLALKTAFAKNKKALVKFENFPKSARRAILEWIYSAKSETTKQARVKRTVDLSALGLKANVSKPNKK